MLGLGWEYKHSINRKSGKDLRGTWDRMRSLKKDGISRHMPGAATIAVETASWCGPGMELVARTP